jgi:hypothetical protein
LGPEQRGLLKTGLMDDTDTFKIAVKTTLRAAVSLTALQEELITKGE